MRLQISHKIMIGLAFLLFLWLIALFIAQTKLEVLRHTIVAENGAETQIFRAVQDWAAASAKAGLLAIRLLKSGHNESVSSELQFTQEEAKTRIIEATDQVTFLKDHTQASMRSFLNTCESSMNHFFDYIKLRINEGIPTSDASCTIILVEINEEISAMYASAKHIGDTINNNNRTEQTDLTTDFATIAKGRNIILALILIIGGMLWYFVSSSISRPLTTFERKMAEAEQGLLETRIELFSDDEFKQVADSFNRMLQGICQMISRVITTSNDLATSSQQLSSASVESAATLMDISKNVNEINHSAQEVSTNLEKTSHSVENFSNSAQKVAQLAETAVEAVSVTTEAAANGGITVRRSVDMIGKIKESVDIATQVILDLNSESLKINEIVNTITAIASQTNLLALNAAIEAARAGEQGKGFTVVADEVRKLAEESAEAAELIGTKIEGILTKTQSAVDSMTAGRGRVEEGIRVIREVSASLDNITQNVNDVNRKITEISQISAEQSHSAMLMTRMVEDITKLTKATSDRTGVVATAVEQQTTTVSQISSSTEDLASLADELTALVSRFTIGRPK